jgi:hypothetical protein
MPPRLRLQQAEVLGPDNRWFCSQSHGRPIDQPELLWCYFIRSGGAADFARRWNEAMSAANRWFCSESHGRAIADEETLWAYYLTRTRPAAASAPRQVKSEAAVMAMA